MLSFKKSRAKFDSVSLMPTTQSSHQPKPETNTAAADGAERRFWTAFSSCAASCEASIWGGWGAGSSAAVEFEDWNDSNPVIEIASRVASASNVSGTMVGVGGRAGGREGWVN